MSRAFEQPVRTCSGAACHPPRIPKSTAKPVALSAPCDACTGGPVSLPHVWVPKCETIYSCCSCCGLNCQGSDFSVLMISVILSTQSDHPRDPIMPAIANQCSANVFHCKGFISSALPSWCHSFLDQTTAVFRRPVALTARCLVTQGGPASAESLERPTLGSKQRGP